MQSLALAENTSPLPFSHLSFDGYLFRKWVSGIFSDRFMFGEIGKVTCPRLIISMAGLMHRLK